MNKVPGVISLLLVIGFAVCASAADRPNIVLILVDDMGFSEIGCFGGEIATPNIDRLARDGVRFTQFYNTARCCPTRAALLTGLYSHQTGVGHMTEDKGADHPGYRGRLNDRCVTIAEVLREAGYFTAMSGKWHVGQNHGVVPWERGFERSLNAPAGGFYYPGGAKSHVHLNGQSSEATAAVLPKDWYSTDLWTEYGLKFIDEAAAAKKPFFLYLAHNAPHFPLQAPQEDISRWRGKFKAGWDKLREERYRRQVEMGLIDKSWPLTQRPSAVKAWDSLSEAEKDRFDHLMAIYAAVIERLDRSIGVLVEGLKQRGVLDNTMLVFVSDNGGNAEGGVDGRFNGNPPGSRESNIFLGQSWATLANTPFVRYKHYVHEGGISSPCVVHWPAVIPGDRRGKFEMQPAHIIDLMATCVDVGQAKYPTEYKGKAIQPMEGVSLRPAIEGKALARTQPIFWEHEQNRAVREGKWKLVAEKGEPWQLYDLEADRTEQRDLAGQQPEKVRELTEKWEAWAKRCNVEVGENGKAAKGGAGKKKQKK